MRGKQVVYCCYLAADQLLLGAAAGDTQRGEAEQAQHTSLGESCEPRGQVK